MIRLAERIPSRHKPCVSYLRKVLGAELRLYFPDVQVPGGLCVVAESAVCPGERSLLFVRYVSGSWVLEQDRSVLSVRQKEQISSVSDRLVFSYLYPP